MVPSGKNVHKYLPHVYPPPVPEPIVMPVVTGFHRSLTLVYPAVGARFGPGQLVLFRHPLQSSDGVQPPLYPKTLCTQVCIPLENDVRKDRDSVTITFKTSVKPFIILTSLPWN